MAQKNTGYNKVLIALHSEMDKKGKGAKELRGGIMFLCSMCFQRFRMEAAAKENGIDCLLKD